MYVQAKAKAALPKPKAPQQKNSAGATAANSTSVAARKAQVWLCPPMARVFQAMLASAEHFVQYSVVLGRRA